MKNHQPTSLSCCDQSLKFGEGLPGTAPQATVWFLLEFNGHWGRKALEESGLPQEVKAYLIKVRQHIPQSRVILIHQPRQTNSAGLRFFIARSDVSPPKLAAFTLSDYHDLLDIDLMAAAKSLPTTNHQSLYLVCTNGKRDVCCALKGVAMYQALQNLAGESVWQSSHLGGHRFAPTVLFLPQGLCYGRLSPEQASTLITAHQNGEILQSHLRGRAGLSPQVQAAENWLRAQSGNLGIDAFSWIASKLSGENQWEITFRENVGGQLHTVNIHRTQSDFQIATSCRGNKQTHISWYHL